MGSSKRWIDFKDNMVPIIETNAFESDVLEREVWEVTPINKAGEIQTKRTVSSSQYDGEIKLPKKQEKKLEPPKRQEKELELQKKLEKKPIEEVFAEYSEDTTLDSSSVDETVFCDYENGNAFLFRKSCGEKISLDLDEFVIGKSKDADYTIDGNKTISRKHAIIYKTSDGYYVEDLNALNHTYLNNEEICTKVKVQNGDIIKLSNEEFEFRQ